MAKQRVPIHQNPRNFVTVEDGATKGARVGTDLLGPDGKLLTADQIINPPAVPGSQNQRTVWKQILEIPGNIQKLAALVGKGFAARLGSGEWALRTLQPGDAIEIQNGDGEAGNPVVSLSDAALASLALADSAVQEVRPGTNVTVDNTDPRRPVVSASGGGDDNPIYPQLTDQLGNPLTDQQGRPLRQNAPGIPWEWLIGVPTYRFAPMTLAAANALTGVQDGQPVLITDLAGGREPCWYDATVASGTKWRRFSDRSIAN